LSTIAIFLGNTENKPERCLKGISAKVTNAKDYKLHL
jgi:hypothetical protein